MNRRQHECRNQMLYQKLLSEIHLVNFKNESECPQMKRAERRDNFQSEYYFLKSNLGVTAIESGTVLMGSKMCYSGEDELVRESTSKPLRESVITLTGKCPQCILRSTVGIEF